MTAKTIILAQGADGIHHKFAFNTANIPSALEKMETKFPDFKVICITPESFYYIEPRPTEVTYFLMGYEAVKAYQNEDIELVKECLSVGDGGTYMWDGEDINDLVDTLAGYLEFTNISKDEYERLAT